MSVSKSSLISFLLVSILIASVNAGRRGTDNTDTDTDTDTDTAVESVMEIEAKRSHVNAEEGSNTVLAWQLSETGDVVTQSFFCTKKATDDGATPAGLVYKGDHGLDTVTGDTASDEIKDLLSRILVAEAMSSSTSTSITTAEIILQDLKVSDSGIYTCTVEYTQDGDMQIIEYKTTELTVSPKETIIEEDILECTTTEEGGCVEWKSESKRITNWKGISQPDCEELCRVTPECQDYNYQTSGKKCRLFKEGCTLQESTPLRQFYRCVRTTATVADDREE